jgi:L-fucose mutarotase
MLKGISPYVSPDLLKTLHEMGHGDELLLADAHFPGHALGKRVLRADGLNISQLLDAILPLLELDQGADALVMMQPDPSDPLNRDVEDDFVRAVQRHAPDAAAPMRVVRHVFYQRAQSAYAVVMTGEMRAYGNILLRKGVTPAPATP